MPAKDLMKDDAVKKSAQAQTEQYAGRHGKMRSYCPFHEPPVPPPPIKTLRRARSNLSFLVKTPSSAPRAIAKGAPPRRILRLGCMIASPSLPSRPLGTTAK